MQLGRTTPSERCWHSVLGVNPSAPAQPPSPSLSPPTSLRVEGCGGPGPFHWSLQLAEFSLFLFEEFLPAHSSLMAGCRAVVGRGRWTPEKAPDLSSAPRGPSQVPYRLGSGQVTPCLCPLMQLFSTRPRGVRGGSQRARHPAHPFLSPVDHGDSAHAGGGPLRHRAQDRHPLAVPRCGRMAQGQCKEVGGERQGLQWGREGVRSNGLHPAWGLCVYWHPVCKLLIPSFVQNSFLGDRDVAP